ncbi:uncharacterized protein LOC127699125 [Mytilus californianus]|uniref:uncharacterized protein LOC127699125 n=1 Tax=Mytilus californianus TaxID=6549 RepID=UPI0022470B94|nr:uncharacterized protein LOC127699125 [Mytilus californianus]
MALSKSFQKGQIPICCQLCEESSEIKWKCLLCDFLLCTKCQKLHKKVKSTDQHTIIDIKDIAVYQQQIKDNPDFSSIPCEIHSGQNCCLFCQTCDEVVCPLCIAKTHNKHNMIELAEGYKITLKTIKTFNSELEVKLTDYVKGITKLHSLKSFEDAKYETEKQKILSREKVLTEEVEKHTKKILKELDKRKEDVNKSINDEEDKSHKIKEDLEFRKGGLTKAQVSVNACEVFSALKEEKTARKQIVEPANTYVQRLPQYIPGKMKIQEALHGELTEPDDDYAQVQYGAKVIKQYKTGLKLVERLVCSNDGTLWIGYTEDNIIQKIELSNGILNIVQEIQVNCAGMALLPSGDLLISTAESNLKILSHTTGKITNSKYTVEPLITGEVHMIRDEKIVIRARKEGPVFPVKGPRQVVLMDIDGRIEKVYDLDNNGKPLFSAPQRITSDNDNNIYVLDTLTKEWNGRIVALDKTNRVRWIFRGSPNVIKENTFKPRDLISTQLTNIIITDMDSDIIHIVNTSGQCIHYMNTKDELGIVLPYAVDIENTGTLYIGCNSCKPNGTNLYTVQFSGF